jgi:hypothetical protein
VIVFSIFDYAALLHRIFEKMRVGFMRRLASISLIIHFFVVFSAEARIINIPADYSTIQEGINASIYGDTVLVQPGIYTENINFNSRQIVLASTFLMTGDTMIVAATIIDGDAAGTVATLGNAEDGAALIGFTIRNGRAFAGGGIYCNGASPTILNNIITGNSMIGDGSWGGGIYCSNYSGPTIAHNWIIGNRAGYGAGIATNNSSPVIEGNFIFGNVATWSEVGGNGGGIYCSGASTPIIRRNDIRSDTAFWGGAGIVCFNNVQALIENNIISENVGGGIQLGLGSSVVRYNYILNNRMSTITGGGINCSDFSGQISNNIIAGNSASDGGAIHCYSRYFGPSIANNTICRNSSGIYLARSNQEIVNSILWRNDEYEIRTDSLSNPSVTYCNVQGGWPGLGNINSDPLFKDTLFVDYHLQSIACGDLADSPCIDAGHPDSTDGELSCVAGLGTPRSDMGAFGGRGNITGIGDESEVTPSFSLPIMNYPNPFNAQTKIQYYLPKPSNVTIEIFDILGRKIRTLAEGMKPAGENQTIWDASGQASGIYLYKIRAGDKVETKKMTLIK